MKSDLFGWILILAVASYSSVILAQPVPPTPFPTPVPAEGFAPATDRGPMATPRKKPDGSFQIQLRDGSIIVGKLTDKQPLKVAASFGEIEIPFAKIASIDFDDEKGTAKVALRNGDRISGELRLDKFNVKTPWANLEIESSHFTRLTSKDLVSCGAMVRRAIVETLPDGSRRVRYVEEHAPVQPAWSSVPYSEPITEPGTTFAPYRAPAVVPTPVLPPRLDTPVLVPIER